MGASAFLGVQLRRPALWVISQPYVQLQVPNSSGHKSTHLSDKGRHSAGLPYAGQS